VWLRWGCSVGSPRPAWLLWLEVPWRPWPAGDRCARVETGSRVQTPAPARTGLDRPAGVLRHHLHPSAGRRIEGGSWVSGIGGGSRSSSTICCAATSRRGRSGSTWCRIRCGRGCAGGRRSGRIRALLRRRRSEEEAGAAPATAARRGTGAPGYNATAAKPQQRRMPGHLQPQRPAGDPFASLRAGSGPGLQGHHGQAAAAEDAGAAPATAARRATGGPR
jgi:hypothetical protein